MLVIIYFACDSEHDCRQLLKELRRQLIEVKREKEDQVTVCLPLQ